MKWFFALFIMFGILCQPALAFDQATASFHQMLEHNQEPAETPFQHDESDECETEAEAEDEFISSMSEAYSNRPAVIFIEFWGTFYAPPYLDSHLRPPRA